MKITKRKDLKTPSWQYDFRYQNKRYRKAGFKTKKEANMAGRIKLNELEAGGPNNRNITFKDYYERWMEINNKENLSPSQYQWYIRSLKIFVDYFGEDKLVKDIARDEFQLFLNKYGVGRSKESVRKLRNCIGICLKDAVYDGYLKKDPTYKVRVEGTVEAKKEEEKYFTINQYLRLIEYLKSRKEKSYILLYLIAITGARFSEVNNMTMKDLNYKPGIIHLPGSKTESSARDVEVDEHNIIIVRNKISAYPIKISGELFGISNNAALKSIRVAQKELGIAKEDMRTVHALRHTHCSYLISQDIPIEYISKRLGHSSISITLDVYSHLLDEYKQVQGERVRELFK